MKRTTPEEKDRKGTLRPGREQPVSLAPLEELPTPPARLSDEAAQAYEAISKLLLDAGRLCAADCFAVEGAAQAFTDWQDAVRVINRDGADYAIERRTPDGTPRTEWKQHPAVGRRNEADKRLRAWLQSLGLTPADRANIVPLEPAEPENPWGDLLQ